MPNFRLCGRDPHRTRQKVCYSNIRILQGAIEMYNMDYPESISELNRETSKRLISGYIKAIPKCLEYPTVDDQYKGENLEGVGHIYCGTDGIGMRMTADMDLKLGHGTLDGKVNASSTQSLNRNQ